MINIENKQKKEEEHNLFQQELIAVIILLLLIFVIIVLWDKLSTPDIISKPFEGEVPTYNGSLHRNIINPLGIE
ncbi:MAG: hypothetical protein ABIG64_06915 [Candidatus Omnitrophota bacterium]